MTEPHSPHHPIIHHLSTSGRSCPVAKPHHRGTEGHLVAAAGTLRSRALAEFIIATSSAEDQSLAEIVLRPSQIPHAEPSLKTCRSSLLSLYRDYGPIHG